MVWREESHLSKLIWTSLSTFASDRRFRHASNMKQDMSISNMLRYILVGASFGAALTAAGVYFPSVILGQMHFTDFSMLKAFLSASAASAIVISLARTYHLKTTFPCATKSLGIFSHYDGNIIGGSLLGLGMALSGACPGTVLPQAVNGVPSGPLVLFGGLLGGILFSRLGKYLQRSNEGKQKEAQETINYPLGISRSTSLFLFETICLATVGITSYCFPSPPLGQSSLVPPIIGGLLIALSQGINLLLTGNTLGVSLAYEQFGDAFWWLITPSAQLEPPPNLDGSIFVIGSMLGSFVLGRLVEIPVPVDGDNWVIGTRRAVLGGVLLTLGARIAGGCTSGHGISGMSMLFTSSFVTVAAMFASGMGGSWFLR